MILEEMILHPKVVGLGEMGLDYFYNHSDKKIQLNRFDLGFTYVPNYICIWIWYNINFCDENYRMDLGDYVV